MRRTLQVLLISAFMSMPALGKEQVPLPKEQYVGSPVGARPIGLGGALAGVGGDENSLYWNPSGLNLLPANLIGISFGSEPMRGIGELFNPSLRHRGLSALCVSTQEMALGWRGLCRLSFEDSLTLQVSDGETTEVWKDMEFWADEYIVSVTTMTQGQTLASRETFLVGVNLKYIRAELGTARKEKSGSTWQELRVNLDRGNGYGLDVGVLVDKDRIRGGLAVQNALARVYWQDYETQSLEANVTGGVSFLPVRGLLLAAAAEQRWNGKAPTIFHLGGEVTLWREGAGRWYSILTSFSPSIRLGLYGPNLMRSDKRVITGGLGYVYSHYRVDTSVYGSDSDNFGYVVTLAIPF